MVALKPREIDSFINRPDFSRGVILLYGPDEGLVSERADKLAAKSGVDLDDPFCVIRLDADDAAADASRIADEAHTIGMFGGKRLIRISGTTRKDLAKAVKPVLSQPSEDAIIIIEAGDLAKSSGLRRTLESDPQGLCIPCYQDADSAIEQLIDEEIVNSGLSIDRDVRQLLKSMLGENRLVSRSELKKLALYCSGLEKVETDHVREIVGDVSKLVLDDVIDAAATGNAEKMQHYLHKAIETGNRPDMILSAALRYFQLLQSARSKIETGNQSVSSVIGSLRPPIHFSRRDKVSAAMANWNLNRINRALVRLEGAVLGARANDQASSSIAGTALLAIAIEASRARTR